MSGFDNPQRPGTAITAASVAGALAGMLLTSSAAIATPAIRTSESNAVPQCVTPDRLMAFVRDRNPSVDKRYGDIARWYKYYGEAWRVRWDYAFYQMVLETNALKFRRGNGERGDVRESQNNFAGIGATGRGVPGDRFPDIKTGVHAQIQHLVAYSGERLADPIAPRTQLRQDDIIDQSRRLRRLVTFADLARRWAADRAYGKNIDFLAEQFRSSFCSAAADPSAPAHGVPAPRPATRKTLAEFAPPSGLGGPKPLMLAGPDDLPWAGGSSEKMPVTAQQTETPPAYGADHKASEKARKVSPVRTIWSRDGNIPPATPAPQTAESQPEQKPTSSEPEHPALPKAVEAHAPAPSPEATEPDAKTDDAAVLPHFKIGPMAPSPSKLGGPVDAMALAPSAETAPSARFKDVVIAEPPLAASPADGPCRVLTASYGGTKTLLVRASVNGEALYTALTVLDGFEKSMFEIYSKASAPGAEIVGEYATKDAALSDARANCPGN